MEIIQNPNLSIIVPGGCNARCNFCFWKQDKVVDNYIEWLKIILDKLPKQFNQISLTGGEPTISPLLPDILKIIDKSRYKKLVLTTNGTNLYKLLVNDESKLFSKINHINISRHCYYDQSNCSIFGTESVPKTNELIEIIDLVHEKYNIDITLNSVIDDDATKHYILNYIKFANQVCADYVVFRKKHGTILPTKVELEFANERILEEGGCSVCRFKTQYIRGKLTTWKAAAEEPSTELEKVYELIAHPSGKLTTDWAGKSVYQSFETEKDKNVDNPITIIGNKLIEIGGLLKKIKQQK